MPRPKRDVTPDTVIESPDSDKKGDRLSIQLDEHGGIAWDRMRPSTRDQIVEKIRRDPKFASAAAPGTAPSGEIFSEPHAAMLFDMLGRFEVAMAMRTYHCTQEQANILLYSSEEKAILTGPLTKVLNKYGAGWLDKWGDEIALAGLLVSVHAPKILKLQDARTAVAEFPRAVNREVDPKP